MSNHVEVLHRIRAERWPPELDERAALDHAIATCEEVEWLRQLCGCAYQLAGCHDAPTTWLDMLGDAAAGVAPNDRRIQGDPATVLLPYVPRDKYAALVARLGELEKAWRERAAANYALNNIAASTIANTILARADDLARVVKGAGND